MQQRQSRDPNLKPPPASQCNPLPQSSRPLMDQRSQPPPRSNQWLHSDEPDKPGSGGGGVGGGAIVAVEKYYSPLQSPLPLTPPKDASTPDDLSDNSNPHVINFNQAMREGTTSSAIVPAGGGSGDGCRNGGGSGGGGEKRRGLFGGIKWKRKKKVQEDSGVVEQIVSRSRKELLLGRAALALRVCGLVLSLVSFTVMATDKTAGWSGDSFDRYKEYRFCFSVNVIAFAYSAFQAYDLSSHMVTGKHLIPHRFRSQFDFIMDQTLSYFLLSASSAATSKIDDWQTNWGKDLFTAKASASVSMSFLAFVAFALSSLISGSKLCNRDIS